jgi:FMN phosphatase YigB (HAD superfamily)
MKIYLDFDDTIFDTEGFKNELVRIFGAAGFSEKDFNDNYEKSKEKAGGLDLDGLFNLFVEQGDFDVRKTRRTMDNIFANADVFVYDDFFDFAREFPKEDLAILSYGATLSQREKIENSKVVPYFREIIITNKGKEESFPDILRAYPHEDIFFVEDKADQIDRVKAVAPFITAMKMERLQGRHRDTRSSSADYVVHDFREVADIINKRSG